MTEPCRCKQALTAAFEEVALALGGVVAGYPIPDEAVWDLAEALDLIHERVSARCGTREVATADDPASAEHPAIVHLLTRLRDRDAARGSGRGLK